MRIGINFEIMLHCWF